MSGGEIVSLNLELEGPSRRAADAIYPFALEVIVLDGWHLQANPPGWDGGATSSPGVVLEAEDANLSEVQYPDGAKVVAGGAEGEENETWSYQQRVTITGQLKVRGPARGSVFTSSRATIRDALSRLKVTVDIELPPA